MAFLTYRQPGVYTRYIDDPTLIRALGLFRIPAILGPGKDVIQITNQIINRGYSKSVSLAEDAHAGDVQIKLVTAEHDLIPSDIISVRQYDTQFVNIDHEETAIVVGVDPLDASIIVIDTDLEQVNGQPLQNDYIALRSTVKETSMKDKVIPAEDLVLPANITGMDEDGNITADLVTADCIDAVGFAPFVNNYRPNVDYDASLIMDDNGNWFIKWLKAAYIVREDLANNGRTNDLISGTANEFFVGHRGLVNSEGVVDVTLDPEGNNTYESVKASIKLEKFVNGAYVLATYRGDGTLMIVQAVDPANGKIILDKTPIAAELQDGIYVTYYYKNNIPVLGEDYYITYEVQKTDEFYLPALYTDTAQIIFDFGRPTLDNPISLSAFMCMAAGAERVILCQTKKSGEDTQGNKVSTPGDYRIALALLEAEELSIVVPLTTDETVQSYTFSHCIKMSSMLHRRERFTIFSVDDTDFARKQDEISFYKDVANGYEKSGSGERIVLLAPPQVYIPQTDVNGVVTRVKVSSYYAAISIMGGLIARDPAEPLTRKTVAGLSGLAGKFKYNEADKDYLAGNGVCVLEESGNVILVRHGMTTDTTTPNKNEISVVQIKDFVAKSLRAGLENGFVGRKLTPETISGVAAATESILGRLKNNQIIFGFQGVSVKEDTFDPTQLNVSFQMKPIHPLNYIIITITLNARIGA